jgi:hypothetical protein
VRTCELSPCGRYRYSLGDSLPNLFAATLTLVLWVMLNPSTADANTDDPTIRKVRGFTESWGHNRWQVVNMFALRATDPKVLHSHIATHGVASAVGPDNDEQIRLAARFADLIVVGWGDNAKRYPERVAEVRRLLDVGKPIKCLGTSAGGFPRHPLMPAYSTPLVDWRAA